MLFEKKKYSSIIQIKSYKLVPNIGVAIIGKVLYGRISSNSSLIGKASSSGIKAKAVITHDIVNSPAYSNILIESMKKYSPFKSDFDMYINILA